MTNNPLAEARYLLVKRGLYYRPKNCGYTALKREAGRYREVEALGRENVTAVHEDEATEYAPAAWQETIIADKDRQIAELTAALAQHEKSDTDRDQLRDDLTRRLESLRQTIADNEPDTAIADNGMTVWDGVRHEVAYLFPRISAALASKTAIDPVTVERCAQIADEEAEAVGDADNEAGDYWIASCIARRIRALGKDQ